MTTIKLRGYRNDTSARARAHRATTQDRPRLVGLTDGTVVGCGDDIARGDAGRIDAVLYGARGTSAWLSDALAAGMVAQ
jgi:hypothetical protein